MSFLQKAYVDTSALIAFRDSSDSYHSLFRQLFSEPARLMTTSLVIAEGHGWFLKRFGIERAFEFLQFVHTLKMLEITPVGIKEIREADKYFKKFSDQKLTLADTCGLLMMDKQKIKICWSTDFHLSLTGKQLVIHSL